MPGIAPNFELKISVFTPRPGSTSLPIVPHVELAILHFYDMQEYKMVLPASEFKLPTDEGGIKFGSSPSWQVGYNGFQKVTHLGTLDSLEERIESGELEPELAEMMIQLVDRVKADMADLGGSSAHVQLVKAYAPPPRKKAELDNMRLLESGPDHIDYNLRLGMYAAGHSVDHIFRNQDAVTVLRTHVKLSEAKESWQVLLDEGQEAFRIGRGCGTEWMEKEGAN